MSAWKSNDYVLVPKVPTYDMVQAGAKLVKDNRPFHTGTKAIYMAMLAAAPQPPAEQDKADAARYRWLRQDNADALYVFEDYVGDELDAAIDAAMKEQQDG